MLESVIGKYIEVLSKVDNIHQNTSRGAVHFFNWLSKTTSRQLLPLSHHHYFTNLIVNLHLDRIAALVRSLWYICTLVLQVYRLPIVSQHSSVASGTYVP